MYISRVVIRNYRNFSLLDVAIRAGVTCLVGENNTGKSNFLAALRLAVDANLSSNYRRLIEQDIHSEVDTSTPSQVIVAVEFRDFSERENECALVGTWQIQDDVARLCYRFRPTEKIRDEIESGAKAPAGLTLEDYHWELTGSGGNDPATVDWNEDLGTAVRFSDLQNFQVVFLPALRDVQHDLRQSRISPLGRLFSVSDISEEEKQGLVETLRAANDAVAETPTIRTAGEEIQAAFSDTAGEAFEMGVQLGMADPSFASIERSLTVLLSNNALEDFDPARNGLGLNNILYISMLLKYFEKRVENPNTAGQLLLIEEPEAHLHPQLQRVLYKSLQAKPFQTLLTTHSTHISSNAPLASLVVFTNSGGASTNSSVPAAEDNLASNEVADLERYLDATRSTLLFARKVILVEGPAELFLIPALVKHVLRIDLDRLGITVVPIFGTHFDIYAKLFHEGGLPKKCAIISDSDLVPEELPAGEGEDLDPHLPDFDDLENEYVKVFRCSSTFERALVLPGTLRMLASAAGECGAVGTAERITELADEVELIGIEKGPLQIKLAAVRTRILNTAKRYGKARFAQVASKYVEYAEEVPSYIKEGVEWLVAE